MAGMRGPRRLRARLDARNRRRRRRDRRRRRAADRHHRRLSHARRAGGGADDAARSRRHRRLGGQRLLVGQPQDQPRPRRHGLAEEAAREVIRVSFGPQTARGDIEALLGEWRELYAQAPRGVSAHLSRLSGDDAARARRRWRRCGPGSRTGSPIRMRRTGSAARRRRRSRWRGSRCSTALRRRCRRVVAGSISPSGADRGAPTGR